MLATEERDDGAAPADAFAAFGGRPEQQLLAALADLRSILSGPRLQVRCLECAPLTPRRLAPKIASFLASLAAWL